jgi:hypothetical protein
MGCFAAKARLDVSDYRRKVVPPYRQGWNSWTAGGVRESRGDLMSIALAVRARVS